MARARKERKRITAATKTSDITAAAATEDAYPVLASSWLPRPNALLHTTWTPAASSVPAAPIESNRGLASP